MHKPLSVIYDHTSSSVWLLDIIIILDFIFYFHSILEKNGIV